MTNFNSLDNLNAYCMEKENMQTLSEKMYEIDAKYTPMDTQQALDIIKDVQINLNQHLLETLIIMSDDPDAFTATEMLAHRIAMAGFRQLMAPMS